MSAMNRDDNRSQEKKRVSRKYLSLFFLMLVWGTEGLNRGGIYMLLSPCVRETSNEVAERVSLHGYTIIVTRLLMFNV